MCGLAGYTGITGAFTRLALTASLGRGIDQRGGHAAGFLTGNSNGVSCQRILGEWKKAPIEFIKEAASGEMCMMHARFATCGKHKVNEAHPFTIRRDGQVVLWGAHNGMIIDAWESADLNDRKIRVDSQEIFELMADGDLKGLRDLTGYGVITWVEAKNPGVVCMARLTEDSDFCAMTVKEGGLVWASTQEIVTGAIEKARLTPGTEFSMPDIGRVYKLLPEGVYWTGKRGIRVMPPVYEKPEPIRLEDIFDLEGLKLEDLDEDDLKELEEWGYQEVIDPEEFKRLGL